MQRIIYIIISIVLLCSGQEAGAQDVSQSVNLVCSDQMIVNESPQPTMYNNIQVSCGDNGTLTNNLVFYMVYISSGTTFTFEIDPVEDIDFDFGSWLNPDLENLGVADRSSRNHPPALGVFTTGLDLSDPELCEPVSGIGPFVPGKVQYYDVQPGDRILIAVDRWEGIESGYSLTFGGDAVLDCDLVGGTYNVCDYDLNGQETFDLAAIQAEYPDATVQFYDDYNNALANNGTGTFSGIYTATTGTNILYARIEDNTGTLVYIKWFYFYVNSVPAIQSPQPIAVCNYNGATTGIFDLTISEDEMLLQGGLDVTYYTSESAALTEDELGLITGPESYTSASTSIFARIENIGGCFLVQEIVLDLVDFTIVPTVIHESKCDTNNTGQMVFNLNSYLPALGVTDPGNYTIHYFVNETYANQPDYTYAITSPQNYSLNLGQNRIIYVRIAIGECFVISEIHLSTFPGIVLDDVVPQLICDDNFDGIYSANLHNLEEGLTDIPGNLMFQYYSSFGALQSDTAIGNPQQYIFNTLPATIWVRATNENGCSQVATINYDLGSDISASGPDTVYLCPGPDGSAIIDLSSYQPSLTSLTGVVIVWFPTYEDAANQTNAIINTTSYTVPPNTGTIYARLRKRDYCPIIISLDYQILSSDMVTIDKCEDSNGIATFDLTDPLPALGLQGVDPNNIAYYEDYAQAMAGDTTFAIQNPGAYTTGISISIYMRVRAGGCFVINEILLTVIRSPVISIASPIRTCSGSPVAITPVNNGQPLSWYASATGTTPMFIGNTFTTPVLTTDISYWVETVNLYGCRSQRVEVTVEVTAPVAPLFDPVLPICLGGNLPALPTTSLNGIMGSWSPAIDPLKTTTYVFTPDAGQCATTAQMVIEVLDIPVVSIREPLEICEGNSVLLSASTTGTTINWYDSETAVTPIFTGLHFQTPDLDDTAVYWAEGANAACTSGRSPVTVTIIHKPSFHELILSEAFSLNNTAEVITTTPGEYHYQLDEEIPQDHGSFTNLRLGRHTISVYNDCGGFEIPFTVIGQLRYFTPNGDGVHDHWNVLGLGTQDAKVDIFDRYGKYLASISTTKPGWDGKYNGNDLPATDYWFVIRYNDLGVDKEYSGHFSLLR